MEDVLELGLDKMEVEVAGLKMIVSTTTFLATTFGWVVCPKMLTLPVCTNTSVTIKLSIFFLHIK